MLPILLDALFQNNHDLKIIVIEKLWYRNCSFHSKCTYKWNL